MLNSAFLRYKAADNFGYLVPPPTLHNRKVPRASQTAEDLTKRRTQIIRAVNGSRIMRWCDTEEGERLF
jgi:hypothetical protein